MKRIIKIVRTASLLVPLLTIGACDEALDEDFASDSDDDVERKQKRGGATFCVFKDYHNAHKTANHKKDRCLTIKGTGKKTVAVPFDPKHAAFAVWGDSKCTCRSLNKSKGKISSATLAGKNSNKDNALARKFNTYNASVRKSVAYIEMECKWK